MFFGKLFFKIPFFLILSLCMYSSMVFGVIGSITDPGFSSKRVLGESFFGPLKGSAKLKFSRNLRRSHWEDFFSSGKKDNIFDTFFIKMDLNLSYPLTEGLPSLKKSPFFKDMLLFFVLSNARPAYDVPDVIRWHCAQFYFCFKDINVGISNSLPKIRNFKSRYSVYLTVPTSKSSYNKKKFFGIGASLNTNSSLFLEEGFQITGISSHFFETAVYGSAFANESGTRSNDIFSIFNQMGLRFSYSENGFLPVILVYTSYLFALDYQMQPFQALSLGLSSVWSLSKKFQFVAGINWGDEIARHEYTSKAKEAQFFSADESFVSGGFSYSF